MDDFKAGYVAIVGRPNVGKSTLLNALINYPLSAVSPKPQTTRNKIIGILSEANGQAIFIDTPGILKPKYGLQKLMQKEIHDAIETADLYLMVVEASTNPSQDEIELINQIIAKPTILAINKVDTVVKSSLLPLIDIYKTYPFREIFPISALKNIGLEELKQSILNNLPVGSPYFPTDQITEHPERFFVAEIIRQTIFNTYGEEIPYSTLVEIEEFKERSVGKNYIRAIIYVERSSQRAILLGRGGQAIKRLGSLARTQIENFLGRPVYLELFVKVKENWRDDERFIKEKIYPH